MKKPIIAILFLTFICQSVFSQEKLSKGSKLLSVSLNIGYSENDQGDDVKSTNSTYGGGLNGGVFIKDNLVVGMGLGYSQTEFKTEFADFDNQESHHYNENISLFARRYFPVYPKFGAYLETSLVYTNSLSKQYSGEDLSQRNDRHIGQLAVDLGLYYFVFDNMSLNLNLGSVGMSYSKVKYKKVDTGETDKSNNASYNIRLTNKLSFDELLTINFHF